MFLKLEQRITQNLQRFDYFHFRDHRAYPDVEFLNPLYIGPKNHKGRHKAFAATTLDVNIAEKPIKANRDIHVEDTVECNNDSISDRIDLNDCESDKVKEAVSNNRITFNELVYNVNHKFNETEDMTNSLVDESENATAFTSTSSSLEGDSSEYIGANLKRDMSGITADERTNMLQDTENGLDSKPLDAQFRIDCFTTV